MGLRRSLLRLLSICSLLLSMSSGFHRALAADQPPSDWIPAALDQLARNASSHTDFTFDKNMLQLSSGLIDGGNADTRTAIAKLNGITVHLYHYGQPGMYDPHQLDAIRAQYHAAGWKHLVGNQNHPQSPSATGGPTASAPPPYTAPPGPPVLNSLDTAQHTDLYIKFQGVDVVGMVLVQATPRNLNIVALSGDLSPLDLLHLRGHFGIPKFSGDGFTPSDD